MKNIFYAILTLAIAVGCFQISTHIQLKHMQEEQIKMKSQLDEMRILAKKDDSSRSYMELQSAYYEGIQDAQKKEIED